MTPSLVEAFCAAFYSFPHHPVGQLQASVCPPHVMTWGSALRCLGTASCTRGAVAHEWVTGRADARRSGHSQYRVSLVMRSHQVTSWHVEAQHSVRAQRQAPLALWHWQTGLPAYNNHHRECTRVCLCVCVYVNWTASLNKKSVCAVHSHERGMVSDRLNLWTLTP